MIHHSTKYDKSLHYRFEVEVIYQTDTMIAVYVPFGTTTESYRGFVNIPSNVLMFYFTDRNHNVHIHWQEDWTPRMHYVNIASTADWADGVLRAVDLDLDLLRPAGQDEIILDDEDEFEVHKVRFSYPQALVDKCLHEVSVLRKCIASRQGLWSDEIFDWRPGKPIPQTVLNSLIGT